MDSLVASTMSRVSVSDNLAMFPSTVAIAREPRKIGKLRRSWLCLSPRDGGESTVVEAVFYLIGSLPCTVD